PPRQQPDRLPGAVAQRAGGRGTRAHLVTVMDGRRAGHSADVSPVSTLAVEASESQPANPPTFDEVYTATFSFAGLVLRRLGGPDSSLDDAVQDLYVAVPRRLKDFEGRSSLRTWVAGIALRVASDFRRSMRRRGRSVALSEDMVDGAQGPAEHAA